MNSKLLFTLVVIGQLCLWGHTFGMLDDIANIQYILDSM